MEFNRRQGLAAAGGLAMGATLPAGEASAQTRAETLRYVTGNTVNSLDPSVPGSTRESFGLSMNVYDRLAAFGRKRLGDNWVFDHNDIRGELAERIDRSPDGRTFTFHIRQGATWHDGTPVTAEDVKWSLDRAVSARSLAPPQMSTGSITSPDQFRIAGPRVVEMMVERPDRLALSNMCVPYAIMINSTLAKRHATTDDPWALNWLKDNSAAGGAYIVEQHRPGTQTILRRNDNWRGGEQPGFRRVIVQTVPEVATRANLVERGDADLSIDLQPSDVAALAQRGRVKVVSVPQTNGFTHISMNNTMAPFDDVKVRQAIAAALPYQDMFQAALFSRGRALFGADWTTTPPNSDFPQPMPLHSNLERARELLRESGHPNGFSTTFTIGTGVSAWAEPMAALIKESLARININVDIRKLPDAQFNTGQAERTLPFYTEGGTAWLPAPDYFFRLYFTRPQRWNFASFNNEEINALTREAQFETDAAKYDAACKRMIEILAAEVPLILAWQPLHEAVMARNIEGYTYWFYRQADFRDLKRV
ncbi:ABC transporter substrate-binding protein [Roseococcus suduntuyensis]|uniref:Peptide/nickel transport system substrate-binding protein n=1 Tax=Roseococcus suduntuyensis TaxID=455361 RepID=A0A840A768_9PROT|nr:ABC transporter substrate-binding protein [Roseococcus suduntuyensis]MBB3897898.1 peptide/nickel transport system substrate-binding protein [Roseococcus suduntuyensis]